MGFFSSIGKVFKKVGKAVGGVAKKAFPAVLSVAKGVIPGGGIIADAVTGVVGAVAGGGGFTEAVAEEVSSMASSATSSLGSKSVPTSRGVKKVVIYK
jgi:aspartokinase-like uncharacterized kinase